MEDRGAAPSLTIEVEVPEGQMYVSITEEENAPRLVLINIGKTGSRLAAWADSVGRLVSLALRSGLALPAIISELSGITSDRVHRYKSGVVLRSGPDGVAYALHKYMQEKSREAIESAGEEIDVGSIEE